MVLIATHVEDQSQPPRTSFYYCSPEEIAKTLRALTSGYHGKLDFAASDPMMDDEPRGSYPSSLQQYRTNIKKESEGGLLYSPPVPCPLKFK